jgi:hypothetical protein
MALSTQEYNTKKNKKFRIGLFVTSLNKDYNTTAASYWIRILQMMEYYQALGAEVYLNNYFRRYDVAIVFRKSKPKYLKIIRYLKFFSKSVYFDTCINIFSLHEEISPERQETAYKIANTADGLICASHRIAEHSKPYAKSVYVMEDPINLKHFCEQKTLVNFDSPVFGWSGVGAKSIYLNRYAHLIDGKIIIISEPQIENVTLNFKFEYIRWNYKSFPSDLLKCDIALLPRDYNDQYNDSHSSFKALVFAVLGIPIIASKVPSYVKMAEFYNGIVFLEDFNDSIQNCINELRNRDLNPDRVRAHYSCENQAAGLLNYLTEQLNRN